MKKILFVFLLILIVSTGLRCQSSDFDISSENSETKRIAILPFKAYVTLLPKDMDKLTSDEFDRLMRQEGKAVQTSVFNYLSRRKRNIELKPIDEVNEIFFENQITADDIHKIDPKALCELLDVDVIVYGRYTSHQVMSKWKAILKRSQPAGAYTNESPGRPNMERPPCTDQE